MTEYTITGTVSSGGTVAGTFTGTFTPSATPPATPPPVIVPPVAPPAGANVTVNFGSVFNAVDPLGAGLVITEFGGVPLVTNPGWRASLAALAPGHCRCSVAWLNGNPGYGAGGSGFTPGTAAALVRAITGIGAVPLVSFNGNTSDNGYTAADGGSLVRYFNGGGGQNGGPVKYWSIGNEPSSLTEGPLAATLAAMLAADGTVSVGVPAAAYWNPSMIGAAAALKGIGGLSYHAYDGGDAENSDTVGGVTGGGFPQSLQYAAGINAMRAMKAGLIYGVEELNRHYEGNDASGPGAAGPFYSAVNTLWIADVIGQVLAAGGHATVYGDSNGPLGIISDGSSAGGFSLPFGTPMPAYWGIGIWTGMGGEFLRYGKNMVTTSTTYPQATLGVFASDSGKVVLVNKGTAPLSLVIALTGKTAGTYEVWATDAGSPSSPIARSASASYSGGVIEYQIPGSTAASVDVS